MINLTDIIRQLTANAAAMRALVDTISDEQAQWQPGPESWSLRRVMEHVYNEERVDFRKHLKEMFNEPPQPWGEWRHEEYIQVQNLQEALKMFLAEREASIEWLNGLKSPNWETFSEAHFGSNEMIKLRAGDVLFSWIDHDHLHIRQMNELLHAWVEKQAAPYLLRYAGGW